uniref:Slc16a-8 n=1 Tax=Schmidtea mediterranea TaxID=79327 RepID=A0A0H3YK67_SCHMD|nr:slc16a-8 [Schmidtea mediterranea]
MIKYYMDIENKKPVKQVVKFFPYLVLGFSALNVIFLGGKRRAFGIFVADLHHGEFNSTSLAELNWIGDSYAALGYISTTLSTALILRSNRRYRLFQFIGAFLILLACLTSAVVPNAHWLFLTHTVLHGFGSSLILSTVGLIVNEYFDKNHPRHILATTLVSGGSVASIVFVQFYAYLIVDYGWRKAFVILGLIYFVVNLSACFVFARKFSNKSEEGLSKKSSVNVCRDIKSSQIPLLIFWTIDRIMTSIVTYGMLLNLADYMRRSESKLTNSTSLTVLFAAGEASTYLIGTIITGLTKKFFHNRLKYILLVSTFLMAVSLVYWEFVSSNKHLSRLLAFVSGFCLGPSITFLFPAGEEMTTLPGHMAYPFSLFGMGIGMAVSPILTALIAQIFDYNWFFLIQGGLIFIKFGCLASICVLLMGGSKHSKSFNIHDDSSDKKVLLDEEDSESDEKENTSPGKKSIEDDLLTVIRNR